MGGKASRNKGAAAELEVAKIINEALGTDIHRNLGQARDGEDDITLGKYRWEIKRRETLAIPSWCRQVEACCKKGEVPIVCYRASRQPWRVVIPLDELLLLIKHAQKDIEFRY